MKKLIMIIMYLTFCVPIIWTQTHQIKDAIQIGSKPPIKYPYKKESL